MKKVLLTGGQGFFCTRFTQSHQHAFQILSTDKDEMDITNYESVFSVFKSFKPDYVIHAAAIAVTDFCDKNPDIAYRINVDGAVNVAKACKAFGAKLVFISTEQVFNGNTESGPFTETDTPVPNTIYGKNKLEAEHLLKDIIDELWTLRFTWLYGLPERNCSINPNILWNTLNIVASGKKTKLPVHEYRGLTYVYDIIDQFDKIFTLPYGLYHTGSHNDLSKYEITAYILKELGLDDKIDELLEKDEVSYKDSPRDVRLNTSKIQDQGIHFAETKDSIKHCLKEFNLKFQI